MDGELVAQHVEEGRPVVSYLDIDAIDPELDQWISWIGTSANQLKEEPQPQVREALGLVTWNPAP
jgi:hypothetical protein